MTRPLRIGLIMQGWTGGIEYIKNIVLALNSLPSEIRLKFEIAILCKNKSAIDSCKSILPQLENVYLLNSSEEIPTMFNRIRKKILRTFRLTYDPKFISLLQESKVDLIYPLTYADFDQYGNYLSSKGIVWIPDFQHKYLPHLFSKNELKSRDDSIYSALSQASTIVLSSHDAESTLKKFYPAYLPKVKVLHFASIIPSEYFYGNPLEIQQKYNLPDKFFIVSNQFFIHKNHPVILDALEILKQNKIYPKVIFTGHIYDSRQPNYFNTFLQKINQLGLQDQIYLLGLIPRYEQLQLMRRAIAVIQPSLFEGWSTVIEDAKSLGKNIIVSDLAVHIEQCPSKSKFFARSSAKDLALHIDDLWSQLEPGPDIEQETLAISESISRIQQFGYQFLSIAGITLS